MTEPTAPDEIEDPEEFAEAAPIDPTPQEVDEYQELIGEEPHEEPSDPTGRSDA
jgi:hypothetical protein